MSEDEMDRMDFRLTRTMKTELAKVGELRDLRLAQVVRLALEEYLKRNPVDKLLDEEEAWLRKNYASRA